MLPPSPLKWKLSPGAAIVPVFGEPFSVTKSHCAEILSCLTFSDSFNGLS